jgi:hypothetical protein
MPANKPSLAAALTAKDLKAALEAQNAINGLTVVATGGEPTTGNLRVTFRTSDKGRNLVPRIRDLFNYTFRVENRMNRAFDVNLQAAFDDHPDWNAGVSTSVGGVTTSTISLQAFNSSNTADTTWFADVVVSVQAPLSASLGQTGRLRLTASIPAPVSKSTDDSVVLTISDHLENEPDSTIDFVGEPRATRALIDVPTTGSVTITFTCRFHAAPEVTGRDFRLRALISSAATVASLYDITFLNKLNGDITETATVVPEMVTETKKASQPVTITNDVNQDIKIRIAPKGSTASRTSLVFNVRIESVTVTTA